jgi:exodeoxyribonuclease VII small subunit
MPPTEDWTYEGAIAQIEETLARLESGQLPLAEVLEQFEQASQELQHCNRFLREKQEQLDLLVEVLDS